MSSSSSPSVSSEAIGGLVVTRPGMLSLPCGLTFIADCHLGAHNFYEDLVREELEAARAYGDRVLLNGDIFDLILPGDHKRYRPECLHPRIRGRSDVINGVLDWAIELFGPYADLIDMIGVGNHEDSSAKHNSVDIILLLVNALNAKLARAHDAHDIAHGGIQGLVMYDIPEQSDPFVIYYHHGFGRGSSSSSAAGDINRILHIEGADVYWLGHKHVRLSDHKERIVPPREGFEPRVRQVRFVRTGAYLINIAGQSQDDLRRQGRKSNYAADACMPGNGRGGARILLQRNALSSTDLTIKVLQ